MLAAHAPGRVLTTCYAGARDDGSAAQAAVRAACAGGWVSLVGLGDAAAAAAINARGEMVLVDLTGLTLAPQVGVLALRPADVQVHWHGLPPPPPLLVLSGHAASLPPY